MMKSKSLLNDQLDCLILAGGLGSRFVKVQKNKPKCMALINGKPFIDLLIDQYINLGINRFILCVGHLKDYIIDHLSKRSDCEIIFSIESKKLDTAGAIKNAEEFLVNQKHLVINGDSFCEISLINLLQHHNNKKSLATIVVTKMSDTKDYGSVTFDNNNKITCFDEKIEGNYGFVNAGLYLLSNEILNYLPKGKKFSIEKEFFPMIINNHCYAFISESKLIDIGTPERYKLANDYFAIKENEL